MTRRLAIRRAILLTSGLLMGQFNALKAEGTQLSVPLDQWSRVVFKYKGKSVTIPVADIFEALNEPS